ncbi:PQQ-dependent sugar dehydrogenase [Candidatus Azambacteria bacterium]|nr:PQQ-dependent sugar dehydrogenase [Candidatus Azambacteria bacterium]MBI3685464.1 PQQ-dependent sugar dehydrogenase [Candidatus Azambacteria bacterium]
MKRIFFGILTVLLTSGIIYAGVFYWRNLRGAWSAIENPPQDITRSIPSAATRTPEALPLPVNATGIPLTLPPGFSISIYAQGLGGPRVLSYDPTGTLLASIPSKGKVVALPDRNGDGIADEIVTVADHLNRPHGIAWRCKETCALYIAESDKVATYDYDTHTLKASGKKKIIDLPDGGNHFTRTIMFMPSPDEDRLLISVGSTCNVCVEKDWRRAKILSANYDGTDVKIFASGVRNSVFMATHPVMGNIWATEMGRDLLGDNTPPDEINVIEEGKNYGWPTCYGTNVHDTDFDKNTYIRNPCMEPFETPSHIDIPAHSAPLGLAFVPEEGWPQEYWHNLFVAYHGSWNRTTPIGYKIVRYKLDAQGHYVSNEDFISGWLAKQGALGRPVDVLVRPGGVMYISDDKAGVVYRVIYRGKQKAEDTSDLIRVENIKQNDIVKSPLMAQGEARGNWFFEASFPVRLYDANGKELAAVPAQAQGEWMTTEFVPFQAQLEFQPPATDTGMLVLEKDNPSGLPEHDDQLVIPVRFR